MTKFDKIICLIAAIIWVVVIGLAIYLKQISTFEKRELITPIILNFVGTNLDEGQREFILKANPFGVILISENIQSYQQTKKLIGDLKALFPDRTLYLTIDQEGGRVDRLRKISEGQKVLKKASYYGDLALKDLDKAKKELYGDAKNTAKILKDLGFDINFAPMVDLTFIKKRQDFDPEISWAATQERSYGGDVAIVVELARQFIMGMDSEGVITSVKHIPGLGRAYDDSHDNQAVIDAKIDDLEEQDFEVFKQLLPLMKVAMSSHGTYLSVDDEPATFSKKVIQGIIRDEIGFKGLLISDALNMVAVLDVGMDQRVQKALDAGIDVVMPHYLSKVTAIEAIKAISDDELVEFNDRLVELGF